MTDDQHYREQIAELSQRARQSELAALETQARELDREMQEHWTNAVASQEAGNEDDALYWAREAEAKTRELQSVVAQLPQPPQYSQQKLQWMQRRPELVNDPRFPQTADAWHKYLTEVVGVADDSPQYAEMMTAALEPQGYQPLPSPDEIVKTINETSKYGRDLSAKTYNKFVGPAQQHVAAQLKAAGKKF